MAVKAQSEMYPEADVLVHVFSSAHNGEINCEGMGDLPLPLGGLEVP